MRTKFMATLTPLMSALWLLGFHGVAQAAWICRGPEGGSIVAADRNGSTMHVATNDGIYSSADDGTNWVRLGDLPRGARMQSVAINPTRPAIVTAAYSGQLYRSIDGGTHWNATGQPLNGVVFHPLAANMALASSNYPQALYVSIDSGANWAPVSLPDGGNLASIAPDPASAGAFFVSTQGRNVFYMRANGMMTLLTNDLSGVPTVLRPDPFNSDVLLWATPNLDVGYVRRYVRSTGSLSTVLATDSNWSLLADPTSSGRFWYVGLQYPNNTLFESIDHGASFTSVGTLAGGLLLADPTTAGHLFGSDQLGFAFSSDAGRSWQSRTHGIPLAQTNAVSINPRTPVEVLAAGNAYGVAISLDGGNSWQAASGITQTHINSLARSPIDPLDVHAGADNGLFHSTDGGRTWSEVAIAGYPLGGRKQIGQLVVDATNPAHLITLPGYGGRLMWSDDAGANWHETQASDGAFDFRELPHANVGTRQVYGMGWRSSIDYRLYRAPSQGTTLVPVADTRLVSAVAVSPNDDNTLLAFARDGQWAYWNVYLSRDGGDHWQLRSSLTPPSQGYEPRLAFNPCNPQTVYALVDRGFYVSHDQGTSWSAEPIAIPSLSFNELDTTCTHGIVTLAAATEYAGAQVRDGEFVESIFVNGFETP